jgi:hypothetical protein
MQHKTKRGTREEREREREEKKKQQNYVRPNKQVKKLKKKLKCIYKHINQYYYLFGCLCVCVFFLFLSRSYFLVVGTSRHCGFFVVFVDAAAAAPLIRTYWRITNTKHIYIAKNISSGSGCIT